MNQLSLFSQPAETLKQWAIVAAIVAGLVLLGAGLWKWNSFTTGLYNKGFTAGVNSTDVANLKAENERLAKQNEVLVTQVQLAATTQSTYAKQQADYARLSGKLAASERMQRTTDKAFNAQLATASAESCREFAKSAGDNFRRSTGHVRRFGEEAIRSSAAAHAAVKASPQTVVGEPSLPEEPQLPELPKD